MQALPPKYVKSVSVKNDFNQEHVILHVVGTFQSGATNEHALPFGATVNVHNHIDHGDWQGVDPVVNVTVKYSAEGGVVISHDFSSDAGVKTFSIEIAKDANGNAHTQVL